LCLGLVGGCSGLRFGEAKHAERDGLLPWGLVEELEGVEYLARHAEAFEGWLKHTQGYVPTAPRPPTHVSMRLVLAALVAAAAVALAFARVPP